MERKLTNDDQAWLTRLAQSATQIATVLTHVHRIAVIGIKPEAVGGPAFSVPAYAQAAGLEIVPVPVYYPDVTDILGAPVHRSLVTVIPPADTVLLFRRSEHVQRHLDEILTAQPSVVWMQSGIRDDAVAETLARAGIVVVQDRCLKIELAHRGR